MKARVIAGALLALILTGVAGEAWSRVIVIPRRRAVVRPHPVYVYPRLVHRVVYYRYPVARPVYLPPLPAYYACHPAVYEGEKDVQIEVEIDD